MRTRISIAVLVLALSAGVGRTQAATDEQADQLDGLPLPQFIESASKMLHAARFDWERSSARSRIAEVAFKRFLLDESLLNDPATRAQWAQLAVTYGSSLGKDEFDRLAALVAQRLVDSEPMINSLSVDDVGALRIVVSTVDESDELQHRFLTRWAADAKRWRSLDPEHLRHLLLWLLPYRESEPELIGAIQKVADERYVFNDEYWADNEHRVATLSVAERVALLHHEPEARRAYGQRLWERFVSDKDRLASLTIEQWIQLRLTLFAASSPAPLELRSPLEPWLAARGDLNKFDIDGIELVLLFAKADRDQVADVTVNAVLDHAFDRFLTHAGAEGKAKAAQVFDLATAMRRVADEQRRAEVERRVARLYLEDHRQLTRLDPRLIDKLVRMVQPTTSKAQIAGHLTATFADDDARLAATSVKDVRAIGAQLSALTEDEAATARMTHRWVALVGGWRDKPTEIKLEVCRSLQGDDDPQRAAMRRQIADHLVVQVLADRLRDDQAKDTLSVIAVDLDRDTKLRAHAWLKNRILVPDGDAGSRFAAAKPLIDLSRKLNDADSALLDEVLVRLVIETDEPFPPVVELGDAPKEYLGYEQRFWGRWGLYKELFEGTGPDSKAKPDEAVIASRVAARRMNRLMAELERRGPGEFHGFAVEVLTVWHTRQQMKDHFTAAPSEVVDRWRSFVDRMGQVKDLTGDQRARWYMARAFTEEIAAWEPTPLLGRSWLELALRTAESEPLRVDITQWIAQGLAVSRQFDEATRVLAQLRPGLGDEASGRRIDRLTEQVAAARQGAQTIDANAADQDRSQHVAELERRLAEARQKNQKEKIRRYEKLLQQAQQ